MKQVKSDNLRLMAQVVGQKESDGEGEGENEFTFEHADMQIRSSWLVQ